MSDNTREKLQTQLKRLQQKQDKTLPGTPKEQELLKQIQELKCKIQKTAEPASIPFDVSPHEAYLRRVLATMSRLELSGIDRKATGSDVTTCLDLGAWFTGEQGMSKLSLSFVKAGNFDFINTAMPSRALTKTQLSWRISDHYPLWAEFAV